jgi:hypothetical protein
MKKEAIKNIFDFLEKKENKKHKNRDNFIWKLNFGDPLTKEDLIVDGDLDLTDSTLKSLPDNLEVKGRMITRFSKIEELPKGLKVDGSLELSHSIIKNIPNDIKIGASLYLHNTKITSLPEGLVIDLWLSIMDTPIKRLPKGLEVNGYLAVSVGDSLDKFSDAELREMVKPGCIGRIIRI